MNKSANPCENFYEFVCGNWKITSDLPNDQIELSHMNILERKIFEDLKVILEEDLKSDDDELLRKLKLVYRSCMNLDEREKVGITPLLKYLNKVGGWPMTIENDTWRHRPWQEIHDYIFDLDFQSAFFEIKASSKFDETDQTTLIFQPKVNVPLAIGAPKSSNNSNENNPYVRLIAELAWIVAKAVETNVSREYITRNAIEISRFHMKLYKLHLETAKEIEEKSFTFEELQNMNNSNSFNFKDVVKNIFNHTQIFPDNKLRIVVRDLKGFEKLTMLLNETPDSRIISYICYDFLVRMMEYSNQEIIDILFQTNLYKKLEYKKNVPQWKQCIDQINMETGLSHYYVKKHFLDEIKPAVNDMIEAIRNATVRRVLRSKWLDNDTKELIQRKLMNVKRLIGYSNHLKNLTLLTKLFEDVVVGPSYIETVLSQHKSNRRRTFSFSLHPIERQELMQTNVYSPNAYFNRIRNTMILPAGILQDPFFVSSSPSALSYGSLGFLIGHEISHAFDQIGILYDENGTYADWWSDEMNIIYKEKSNCFVKQFNEYDVNLPRTFSKKIKLNGLQTLNENIADSVGLEATFEAFHSKMEQEMSSSRRLPDLQNFTDRQMFFISFAHTWCNDILPKYFQSFQYDVHSPAQQRVEGALSNIEEFSEAFKCPLGSALNPENKCKLW